MKDALFFNWRIYNGENNNRRLPGKFA